LGRNDLQRAIFAKKGENWTIRFLHEEWGKSTVTGQFGRLDLRAKWAGFLGGF
jgi:hypothetical protein